MSTYGGSTRDHAGDGSERLCGDADSPRSAGLGGGGEHRRRLLGVDSSLQRKRRAKVMAPAPLGEGICALRQPVRIRGLPGWRVLSPAQTSRTA